MRQFLLLDLYCGAGGCTKGYQEAGFRVVGVDNKPQPHYVGDDFILGDALDILATQGASFDAFHASPPCQLYSHATPPERRHMHPDLIAATRDLLRSWGKPYVIENVAGARKMLVDPVMLCGTMFGLNIQRHRFFEVYPFALWPPHPCDHSRQPVVMTGTTRRSAQNGGRREYTVQECRDASGLYWMTRAEIDEAIPPAYTKYIGNFLRQYLESRQTNVFHRLFRQIATFA